VHGTAFTLPSSQFPNSTDPASTSALKLQFDLAQLEYLQSKRIIKTDDDPAQEVLATITRSLTEVAQYLKDYKLNDSFVSVVPCTVFLFSNKFCSCIFTIVLPILLYLFLSQRVVRLNTNSLLKAKSEYLNRLVHLESDSSNNAVIASESLVHMGAMNYLKSIASQLQSTDFIVVDMIMQVPAMQELSRLLLSSTVWFDVTNGATFAAHYDDGLVFSTVTQLVQVQLVFGIWYLPLSLCES
jgi:hypothetical protein